MGLKSMWRTLVRGEPAAAPGAVQLPAEPLECVSREARRSEHLANLGMKRNKSFRKSITKKFKRKEKSPDLPDAPPPPVSTAPGGDRDSSNVRNIRGTRSAPTSSGAGGQAGEVQVETRTSIGARIEGGRKIEVIKVAEKKDPAQLVGEAQPLPAHIQNDAPHSVDKLRRSFRHSMRKRREKAAPELSKMQKWQLDEAAVRSGTCKFYVKYFGCCEVYESRGMQVCEAAVESLKVARRRTVRGTMLVSGDSIRLVDDDTKAMVLDQTIEKVSFCAPDRNFDRGFSYICRDGTTRRWMCHAFFAVGDTGERLSHAVGCAFGICLENKQKREKMSVSVNYNDNEASFTRVGTFRAGTMAERLQDPQAMKPVAESPKLSIHSEASKESEDSAAAVERPRPSDVMYQRQASFRGLGQLAGATPFKRGGRGSSSLRPGDLPSSRERVCGAGRGESPILEDMELPPLMQLEQGAKVADLLTSGRSSPAPQLLDTPPDSCSSYSTSPPPSLLQPLKLASSHPASSAPDSLGSLNPWDSVADPPPAPSIPVSSAASSLISLQPSSASADSWLQSLASAPPTASLLASCLQLEAGSKLSVEVAPSKSDTNTSSGYNSPSSSTHSAAGSWQQDVSKSILEDPFDAEWAAIATRTTPTPTPAPGSNPFLSPDPGPAPVTAPASVKAFELQL